MKIFCFPTEIRFFKSILSGSEINANPLRNVDRKLWGFKRSLMLNEFIVCSLHNMYAEITLEVATFAIGKKVPNANFFFYI